MVAPKWPGWYRAARFMDVIGISFLVYTLAIMGFGLYTARFAKKSSQDYFLADRGLGPGLQRSLHRLLPRAGG